MTVQTPRYWGGDDTHEPERLRLDDTEWEFDATVGQSGAAVLTDLVNDQHLIEAEVGGPVDIPNTDLTVGGSAILASGNKFEVTNNFRLDYTNGPYLRNLVSNSDHFRVENDSGTDQFIVRNNGTTAILAGDLEIPSGNDIVDSSAIMRFRVRGGFTALSDDNGDDAFVGDSGAHNLVYARNGQPFQVRDAQGSFDAIDYTTAASAGGGTLSVNATQKFTGGNLNLNGTARITSIPSSAKGLEWSLDSSLATSYGRIYFNDANGGNILWQADVVNDQAFRVYNDGANTALFTVKRSNGLAVVNSGSLRLPDGEALQSGGGTQRIQLRSQDTLINDETGSNAIDLTGGTAFIYQARNGTPWRVRDAEGSFTAMEYTTAASAGGGTLSIDGTLEIGDGSTSGSPLHIGLAGGQIEMDADAGTTRAAMFYDIAGTTNFIHRFDSNSGSETLEWEDGSGNDLLTIAQTGTITAPNGPVNLSGGDLQRNGTTVVSTQQAAIASLTNNQSANTTDGTLEDIGDTTSADQSPSIERNITELNEKLNAVISALESHGLIAT